MQIYSKYQHIKLYFQKKKHKNPETNIKDGMYGDVPQYLYYAVILSY